MKVLVEKPTLMRDRGGWVGPDMDVLDGQVVVVKPIKYFGGGYEITDTEDDKYCTWWLSKAWCTVVDDDPPEPPFTVLVHKPSDTHQDPTWAYDMDHLDGTKQVVEHISLKGYYNIGIWMLHPDWCTIVHPDLPTDTASDEPVPQWDGEQWVVEGV